APANRPLWFKKEPAFDDAASVFDVVSEGVAEAKAVRAEYEAHAPGSDLDLSHDGYASGNHAQIVFEGGTWMLYDRNSTNGTFSNGVRITHTRLDHGMTVRLGSTEVRFMVG
ncbi:MAG: FHA domain-containing protein, partial [Kofleriaceae bacterium]